MPSLDVILALALTFIVGGLFGWGLAIRVVDRDDERRRRR